MMKHNSLDEDLNDILSLPMFQISIHGILAMYVADIKSNSLCSSILLFIAKLNHTHRKLFKQQFNYLVIEGGAGVRKYGCLHKYSHIGGRTTYIFSNYRWPIITIHMMIPILLQRRSRFISPNFYLNADSPMFLSRLLKMSVCSITSRQNELNYLNIHPNVVAWLS